MKALLAQLRENVGDNRGNAQRAADAITSHPEADYAVFPELFLPGYTYNDLDSLAIEADDECIQVVQKAAAEAGTAVVIGFAEKLPTGVANSAACINTDGHLVTVYRKVLLFGRERDVFSPGNQLVLVPLGSHIVGPLICFDVEFPEPARKLAVAGAELLITASANMDPFYVDHEIAVRARANENRLPHLYANMVGAGEGMNFVGGSRVVSALGDVVIEGTRDTEQLIVCDVPERMGVDERVDYIHFVTDLPRVRHVAEIR